MRLQPLERMWIQRSLLVLPLLPFSVLYCAITGLRRLAYTSGILHQSRLPVPVIVVGNLTVGGTGKTPLIEWLAAWLVSQGYRPGLVARGYGGNAQNWPQQVRGDSDPYVVGDEPVLLVQNTGCPMAVGPDRVAAVKALLEYHHCNVILSDDGLQHYRLARDIEIAVIDGVRRFDNGFCLPAGPLRERSGRLNQTDLVVINGLAGQGEHAMRLVPEGYVALGTPDAPRPLEAMRNKKVHAVAGIGNPKRFFDSLRRARIEVIEHEFPDHHPFVASDLDFGDDIPVMMTGKDAVKCRRFASGNMYVVPCRTELDGDFGKRVLSLLQGGTQADKNA